MPSSYSASLRFELQFSGENVNAWGDKLNAVISRVDTAVAGWLTKALTGDYSLTTVNGGADEARTAMLKFTGTGGGTVTVPSASKAYVVWNATNADLTVSNGSSAVIVKLGEIALVATDGGSAFKRVQPTDFGGATLTSVGQISGLSTPASNDQAANKKYVDDAAFAAASGSLPGQSGNAGKFLATNGTAAAWSNQLAALVLSNGTAYGSLQFGTSSTAANNAHITSDIAGGLQLWRGNVGAGTALVSFPAGGGIQFSTGRSLLDTAQASDVRGGSDGSKALTAAALMASSAFQSLTDASTIAWNCANGYNATVTLTASGHTVGAPSGLYDGLSVGLELVQDATGSRTVSWASIWDFGAAGLPALQITASKADRVFGQYNGRTGKIDASFRKGA